MNQLVRLLRLLVFILTVASANGAIWETTTINGQTAGILKPDDYYTSPRQCKIIIYHRGVGETVADIQFDPKGGVIEALLDADFMIATVGTTPQNNFGNDDSQIQYPALLAWMLANTTNTGAAGILSQSGGGPSGIRQYLEGGPEIKSWYGIYPMTNLTWGALAGFSVGVAWNFQSPAAGNPDVIPAENYNGKFLRATHSPADTIVPKDLNTDQLRARVIGNVEEFEVIVSSGEHGHTSSFQPTDIVNYFNRTMVEDVEPKGVLVGGKGIRIAVKRIKVG